MAAMSVGEEDAKLASQCLDLCQTLAGKSLTFSFSLTIGSSFSFSVDTRGKEVLVPHRKKKTPSTLRRDARRREELLKKKLNASTVIFSKSEQASAKEAEVPRKVPPVVHHHPSPPASSERRQVIVVGREKALSFNQLDGQEDISLLDAAPSSEEGEEDIVDVGLAERDVSRFCEKFKVPPAKVRCSKPGFGIGTFLEIDEKSENFVYEFQNGELVEF